MTFGWLDERRAAGAARAGGYFAPDLAYPVIFIIGSYFY